MATVELTLEQLVEAVRQLPGPQRKRLLQEIEKLPSADQARLMARRLRGTHRMAAEQRKRMSQLLLKGNSGTLTLEESDELDRLVAEFERKTLELAGAVAGAGNLSKPRRSANRTRSN